MVTTHEVLPQLIFLQKVDSIMDNLEDQKKKLAIVLEQARLFLTDKREELSLGKKTLELAQKTRGSMELDSKSKLASISKHKEQIYQIKSNEAYAALQHEIEDCKKENLKLEEQILVKMEEEEQERKTMVLVQNQIKEEEKKVKEEESKYQEALAMLEQKIALQDKERQQICGQIDRQSLDRYERIRRSKGTLALAKILEGSCGGCRIKVRPQMIIEIKKNKELIFCDSCGRVLYVE